MQEHLKLLLIFLVLLTCINFAHKWNCCIKHLYKKFHILHYGVNFNWIKEITDISLLYAYTYCWNFNNLFSLLLLKAVTCNFTYVKI